MAARPSQSRRDFVGASASCAAYITGLLGAGPGAHRVFGPARGAVIQQEPWGRVERVADGVWAIISAPLDDRTTLCNGGFIAGRNGVLAVEAFATTRGSQWAAEQARSLTGRWPTHVLLSHYHGDHSSGVAGYVSETEHPAIYATAATRDRVLETDRRRDSGPDPDRSRLLEGAHVIDPNRVTELDLGGRRVRVVPRLGHTSSDVTVELEDPSVVFCGDLVWNGMFPNYVDAIPSQLSKHVRDLIRSRETVYVPGHGRLGGGLDLATYVEVLDAVEAAARLAKQRGVPAEDAAKEFALPDALGEWFMFSDRYYARALGAWEREL